MVADKLKSRDNGIFTHCKIENKTAAFTVVLKLSGCAM